MNQSDMEANSRDEAEDNLGIALVCFPNNETAAMLVSQTNPVRDELFSYANAFFCSNKFA